MSDDSIKVSSPSMADEKGLARTHTGPDSGVGEVNDITQLGYKPEMTRNRSMLTLLFQSLAIAAIRMSTTTAIVMPLADEDSQRMEKVVHS